MCRIGYSYGRRTIQVKNLKWQLGNEVIVNGDYITNDGICLAKACLGGTMDSTSPLDSTINPNSVGEIKEYTLTNNYVRGCIMDFDISSTSGQNMVYRVRVVASTNPSANLRVNQNAPVPASGDTRGSWSWSEVQGEDISYTVGTGDKMWLISNSANDIVFTKSASYDSSNALANTGHFGATYKITLKLTNNTSAQKTVRIRICPRGGIYGGAIKVDGTTYGIPKINTGGSDKDPYQVANVTDKNVPANSSINVPLQIMHAGGSSLGIGILCSTI